MSSSLGDVLATMALARVDEWLCDLETQGRWASLRWFERRVIDTENAPPARGAVGESSQRDHSVWFHAPAVLTDWLLYERSSPSSAHSLSMANGTMFNRSGDLVCTVRQEMYFPPSRG